MFVALVVSGCIMACSSSKMAERETRTMVGTLQVIGNEPFTKLAIEADDGTMYVLRCSDEVKAMLWSHQGERVKVDFREAPREPEGKQIELLHAELVPK